MMVPHHEGAVEMARISQQRAERAELRALAETVIRQQEREIAELRRWRQAWFGTS